MYPARASSLVLTLSRALDVRNSILLLLAAAVLTSLMLGANGTTATFTAQTSNASNVFNLGTIVLNNKVGAAAACLSSGSGGGVDTNANSCDVLFTGASVAKPGDSFTADLTIKNDGTLNASALKVFANSACANANNGGINGTGNPCGKLLLFVQECGAACTGANGTTCWYGGATGTAGVNQTCNNSNATRTPDDFRTSFGSAAAGLSLTGGLNAGSSRFFRIGVNMPNGAAGADNAFMGRRGTFDLTWYMEQ